MITPGIAALSPKGGAIAQDGIETESPRQTVNRIFLVI
jgi:hypothetical protein